MSTALAMGATTAVLRRLIETVAVPLIPSGLHPVTVSAIVPSLIAKPELETRLNIFLYHVSPNPAWRNTALPSRDAEGTRVSTAPLALDLEYLVTAYAKNDYETEVLLGAAMQTLHEVPILSRAQIRRCFEDPDPVTGIALPAFLKALGGARLAEQIETIRLTLASMSPEESSKLWTALATSYRSSVAYQASVVFIETTTPAREALPVLRRGADDRGAIVAGSLEPPVPTLTSIELPEHEAAVKLGEKVTLHGHHLAGTSLKVFCATPHLPAPREGTIVTATDRKIVVTIPDVPADWPAGAYMVSLSLLVAGDRRASNALPLLIAPSIPFKPATTTPDIGVVRAGGNVTFTAAVAPHLWPNQIASLIVGSQEIPAEAHDPKNPVASVKFTTKPPATMPAGTYPVRLRVDGVDSRLIDRTTKPPRFDPNQVVTVPV